MMSSVLDDFLAADDEDDDVEPDREPAGDVIVCDYTADDKVCGENFDTVGKLNQHRALVHKIKKDGTAFKTGGPRKTQEKKARDKKPARESRVTAQAQPVDRAAAYTQGIATIGLGLYMIVPRFDQFDHACVNNGAPGLAAALDAVGDRQPTVRAACDLILGAGSGGPYVQLILAALAISAPIAANHGILPANVATRFGAIANMPPPPAPEDVQQNVTGPDAAPPTFPTNPNEWTAEEWIANIQGMPPTVGAEVASRMMSMAGATTVEVPDTNGRVRMGESDDGEHGSEQPAPAAVPPS